MSRQAVGLRYADNLTSSDLTLLAAASGGAHTAEELRHDPSAIPGLLDRPKIFETMFGRGLTDEADRWLVGVSPFLAFAVAVHRSAAELAHTSYTTERAGARERIPLFDGPELAAFLDDAERRLFLAELLASFARVASGRYAVRTRRGWRTRRYSELDPVRLAGLVESVPPAERPGAYRRLGDVALFLAGVFPDYTRTYAFGPVDTERLLRVAGVRREEREELAEAPAIDLLEHLGARWYRHACELATVRTSRLDVIAEVAERFRQARRVLNFVADRYLFPAGGGWFASPGT